MRETEFPTSFAQQRLWFLDQLDPGTSAYNLPRAFRLTGSLDAERFSKAVQSMISRHAALRTIFTSVEGEAKQVVLDDLELVIPIVDLSLLSTIEREQTISLTFDEQARKPFDLSTGPLLRAMLLRLGSQDHIFLLVMHHIITDGWSMSVLLRDIGAVYERYSAGKGEPLPDLTVQYADFSRWQRDAAAGDAFADQLGYWKRKLHGAQTILTLPVDRPSRQERSSAGKDFHFHLPPGLKEKLESLTQSEGATLFMVLLAVFQILLWRYTLQDSILIGIPTAGRKEEDLYDLVGLFVNTLVIRADLGPEVSFRQLLSAARTNVLEALDHQDVPFEKLVEVLNPVRTIHQNPLFQVMFVFQNAPKQELVIPGLVQEEIKLESGASKFGLSLEVLELDGLYCTFEYESDLYDESTISRMAGHFTTLLERVIEAPSEQISSLSLLTPEEVYQFAQWNTTRSEYPRDLCIHTVFEEQAALTPGKIALLDRENQLSYRELNQNANRLALRLIGAGVRPGMLVGISLERSFEMVIALLATLKTGAAYVPLDPNQPEQRLRLMVEDAQAALAITRAEFAGLFRDCPLPLIVLDDAPLAGQPEEVANPSLKTSAEGLAYVIYTSGSTGRPKGVQGTHRASLNRFAWMWKSFPFVEGEVCCQKTALGFVDSVWEIFGPLLRGIPLLIIPHESVIDPREFVKVLATHDVSRIVLVPSLLQVVLEVFDDLQARLPRLKLWTCSGEALSGELAKRFARAMPEATLLNIYGSAEVAADVAWHVVTPEDEEDAVPIGRPISNVQLFVLDRYTNRVPQGVPGDLYIGGDCLSPGYWKKPELTAERLLVHSFTPGSSIRIFRTGDIARYLHNGEIQYLGRADNQVKIRGIRVELGEIETALASHPRVMEAAVLLAGVHPHEKLIAYLVTRSGVTPSTEELRRSLRSKLPEYMLPSEYFVVDAFPLLPSGKIDRLNLSAQTSALPLDKRRYIAPETATQEGLAGIWRELLKVEQIGITDNFFELGGHSLSVMQVIARIRKIFEVEIPLRNMFENPTLAGLAIEVETAQASGVRARAPILSRIMAGDAETSKRTILAQLDKLSQSELQDMLEQILRGKQAVGPA